MIQNHLMQLLCLVAMEPPVDLGGRRRPERAGQGPPGPADLDARGRRPPRRPGPVHRRLDPGEGGPRLPPGEGGRARLDDRHLRRPPGDPEQLAMGGRPVLPPDRQAAAEAGHRDRHPVPQAADDPLRGRRRGQRRGQPAGPPDPAQRGGEPRLPGQDPRLAAAAPGGPDGLPLRDRLRRPRRPRRTSGSCSTSCSATRRSTPGPTPSRPPGSSSTRSSKPGRPRAPPGPSTTPPGPGAPEEADKLMEGTETEWRRL